MKTKEIYSKPEIEMIEMELQGVLALSDGVSLPVDPDDFDGPAGAPSKGNFWGE